MNFDYYYGSECEQFSFYRIPKVLFTEDAFSDISAEAKTLYGILLDRMQLSAKNDWLDDDGRVFIIYTIEQIQEAMGCGNKKAVKLLDELEKKANLIERVNCGIGKPSLIYVKNFITGVSKGHSAECQNDTPPSVKTTFHRVSKRHGSNTDTNNTNYSNTDYSESVGLSVSDYDELVYEFGKEEVDYQIRKIKSKHYKGCMNKETIQRWCQERKEVVPPPRKKNSFTDFPQRQYSKQEMEDLERMLLRRGLGLSEEGDV